jgi:hypothetical protein
MWTSSSHKLLQSRTTPMVRVLEIGVASDCAKLQRRPSLLQSSLKMVFVYGSISSILLATVTWLTTKDVGIPSSATCVPQTACTLCESGLILWYYVTQIKDQHSQYLRKELTAQRDKFIPDTRVHCCLFFINPTGHSLKPVIATSSMCGRGRY